MLTYWGKMNLPTGAKIQSLEAKLIQELQRKPGTKETNQVHIRGVLLCGLIKRIMQPPI